MSWPGPGDKSKKVIGRALFGRLLASRAGLVQADPAAPLVGLIEGADVNVVRSCPFFASASLWLLEGCKDKESRGALLADIWRIFEMTEANLEAQSNGSYALDHESAAALEASRCLKAVALAGGHDVWLFLTRKGSLLREPLIASLQVMGKREQLGELPSIATSIALTYAQSSDKTKLKKFTEALMQIATAPDEAPGGFGLDHGAPRSSLGMYNDCLRRAERYDDDVDVGAVLLSNSGTGFRRAALVHFGDRYREHFCRVCHRFYVCTVLYDDRPKLTTPLLRGGVHSCPETRRLEHCFYGYGCPDRDTCFATLERRPQGGTEGNTNAISYAPREDRRDFEKMMVAMAKLAEKKGGNWILHLCRCGVYFPQKASTKQPHHHCVTANKAKGLTHVQAYCKTGCKGECVPKKT